MNNYEKSQEGLEMIKAAILSELRHHPDGMTNAEITHQLGLESDSEGKMRNYLSWSLLGILLGEGKIRSNGEGRNRTYHLKLMRQGHELIP
ncbi:MAG TPA: hypothetical protein VGJ48_10710 [Pyrinomonadaceae bacterium]